MSSDRYDGLTRRQWANRVTDARRSGMVGQKRSRSEEDEMRKRAVEEFKEDLDEANMILHDSRFLLVVDESFDNDRRIYQAGRKENARNLLAIAEGIRNRRLSA